MLIVDHLDTAIPLMRKWDEYTMMTAIESYIDVFQMIAVMEIEELRISDYWDVC